MSLLTSKVPRSLETKTKLLGFELGDVLLVFLYLTLSNLAFGRTELKLPIVWGGTLLVAGLLHLFKKGKPDRHLEHFGQYLRTPDILAADTPDTELTPYPYA